MKLRRFSHDVLCKFRRLPTPLLFGLVLSRFAFGVALGTLLAGSHDRKWQRISLATFTAGLALATPGAIKVLKR